MTTLGQGRPARFRLPFFDKLKAQKRRALQARQFRRTARQIPRLMPFAGSKTSGFVDLTLAAYAFDTTGTVTLIATVAQGASVSQRIGKKIQWKSIQIRGSLQAGTTATTNDCALILVYDKRPTGALPTIADVLVSANPGAFNNDANSGRFQIIRRYDFVLLGNRTTPATGLEVIDASDFIKFSRPCVYKAAATGAIADIEQGAIYAITIGNNTAGATAAEGSLAYRVRFTDTMG